MPLQAAQKGSYSGASRGGVLFRHITVVLACYSNQPYFAKFLNIFLRPLFYHLTVVHVRTGSVSHSDLTIFNHAD